VIEEEKRMNEILNTIHLPEDAGEHSDDLRRILARIPENWGRWISCASGWYPLVIELDQRLSEIYPDYELHQVKEKFGTLRYYIGFPQLNPQCCIDLEETRPCDGAINPDWLRGKERTLKEQFDLDVWFYTNFMPHLDSEEHHKQMNDLEPERERRRELSEKMHEIIDHYERLSAKTCEICGAEAETRARNYWYRTLCEPCGEKNGYLPIPDEDDEDED
jgi:hypothetical protein